MCNDCYVTALLLKAPWTVPITNEVAKIWWDTIHHIEQAQSRMEEGEYTTALDELDYAAKQLRILETDPGLLDPIDHGLEHYAAIFSPLLFPLLLPLTVGTIREFKRYRKLSKDSLSR